MRGNARSSNQAGEVGNESNAGLDVCSDADVELDADEENGPEGILLQADEQTLKISRA